MLGVRVAGVGWGLLAACVGGDGTVYGQAHSPPTVPSPPTHFVAPLPLRRLADSVYLVVGDTGRGSEGRPNAGFVVTRDGVVVVDALASPRDGRRLVAAVRRVTAAPIRWLVLTHHHPDHHFGAIALRRVGARVIAHPDARVLAAEGGDSALVADWTRVVGRRAMRGFAFADRPDRAVSGVDTLRLGGRPIVVMHPGAAHTPGDLMVWLPKERVLFAGDIVVEDGVTMLVDGSAPALLRALGVIDSLAPRVVVPGHGSVPRTPAALTARTRTYVAELQASMRDAVEHGRSMQRALASLPPVDSGRPVSLHSRERRNAVRVYLEQERLYMGLDSAAGASTADSAEARAAIAAPPVRPATRLPTIVSTDQLAVLLDAKQPVRIIDIRADVFAYLKAHVPGAVYLNMETLRAAQGGMPIQLLSPAAYAELFSRLGIAMDQPVVIYSAGETRNIDATFLAWILAGFGHPDVRVLDGGYFKWELEQRPLEQRYPRFAATHFPAEPFAPERASLDDVLAVVRGKAGAVLVDARPPDQYAGRAGAQMRHGHIPGAVDHYWQDDLRKEGFGTVWKSLDELRTAYAAQGITPDKDIIAYCNGATEASHVSFTLRYLLGYPRVRVYVGSWTEWAERTDLPIASSDSTP